jgi:hypothetical protein
MAICDYLISKAISVDCENQSVAGLEPNGLIINRDDIDFSATTFNAQNPNIIETLVLKSGKKAYDIIQQGATPFTGVASNLNVGTYRNTWTHDVPIAVLGNDPDIAANIIDKLSNGTFVVILRNVQKGTTGDAEYQVYGYAQGLRASEGVNEKYSEDTDGGWLITLQEQRAPKSAMFFFNTDATTTATAYEALKGE